MSMKKPDTPPCHRVTRSMIHKDYDKTKKPTLEQLLKLTKSQQKLLTACSDNDLTTGK